MKKYIYLLLIFLCSKANAQVLKDCSHCSIQIIKDGQVEGLSVDEIRILTNEIFARNGYQFENSRFQNYFEQKSWYKSKNDNKNIVFNETEKLNIKFLQEKTKEIKEGQEEVIRQLKNFKTLVLTDKTADLKRIFGFFYEEQYGDEEAKLLKEVLYKINLDDINYYKRKGLNSTMIDNGFVKIVYEISIDGESIQLYYNYMAHSKIIENFDEFTDYHSEEEYMYNWQFDFKSNKLKFIRVAVAG